MAGQPDHEPGGPDGPRTRSTTGSAWADLISFGRGFIAHPDLVERLRTSLPIAPVDTATYYVGGDARCLIYHPHTRHGSSSRPVEAEQAVHAAGGCVAGYVETGLRRPTLERLLPLARAYGVTLDELVDAPPTGDPRINLRPIACQDGSTILPLTQRPGGIQAYKFILPTGNDDEQPSLRTHEGYDWVYVLNGTLRLVLGEHYLILRPGEAAEFDTRTPHWFGATSSGPVEFLSLIGRQGERAHVRAAPKPVTTE